MYIRYIRHTRRKLNRLIDRSNINNLVSVEIQMTNFVETNDFELRLRYFRPARSHPSIVPFGPRFPLPARRSNRIYLRLPRFHSTPCNSNGCLISHKSTVNRLPIGNSQGIEWMLLLRNFFATATRQNIPSSTVLDS